MKRLAVLILLVALCLPMLAGCSTTKTVYNLEFIETVKTSRGDILQFKDSENYKVNYFVSSEDSFNLEKGQLYNVEVTVESFSQNKDFVKSVEIANK